MTTRSEVRVRAIHLSKIQSGIETRRRKPVRVTANQVKLSIDVTGPVTHVDMTRGPSTTGSAKGPVIEVVKSSVADGCLDSDDHANVSRRGRAKDDAIHRSNVPRLSGEE